MSGYIQDLSENQSKSLATFKQQFDENIGKVKSELDSQSTLKIYGVDLESDSSQRDIIFLKFLRARDFKSDQSYQMLVDSLKWRKEFNTDNILNETFPDCYKTIGGIHKTDKDGRPVMVNYYNNIDVNTVFGNGVAEFLRFKVQQMEMAIQQLQATNWQVEDLVVIHDYKDVSMFRMDPRVKQASSQTIQTLQNNYPEFLFRKFFINVPYIFQALYSLFTVFSSERTKSKFNVLASEYRKSLLNYIAIENLPHELGGFQNNNDADFNSITTIELKPKSTHDIELGFLDTDKTVEWEFIVLDGGNDVNSQILLNNTKQCLSIKSKESNTAGSFQIEEDGKYSFMFDNSQLNQTKTIAYRILSKSKSIHLHTNNTSTTTTTTTTTNIDDKPTTPQQEEEEQKQEQDKVEN
ncbi:hypothetical protein CYY_000451 [Polysphondylium violaceum]|uniref:Cellular retinaldehyde-binding/triple function domain-containing protein n=1 Tax=Polysphondylium violaceum TaxID=133409 RepID=A0A8J4Q1U0_9MYCE|nr:hypothetical protein CYY_000451 [Polysphondylium violaceum]